MKSTSQKREDNPFEDPVVANEWVTAVEGERELIRDKELYPMLRQWAAKLSGVLVDIGAGQGICADHVQGAGIQYIGVEPSEILVARAEEKYAKAERSFVVGTAYELPVDTESADAAFSVNVWFHLEDLDTASRELSRILKAGGKFLISTANPNSYHHWQGFFSNAEITDKIIDGKAHVPVQSLSRNRFYKHTLEEITQPLESHGLVVESVLNFGDTEHFGPGGLFINIYGQKS